MRAVGLRVGVVPTEWKELPQEGLLGALILASAVARGQAWAYVDRSVVSGPVQMRAGRNNAVLCAHLVLTIVCGDTGRRDGGGRNHTGVVGAVVLACLGGT